MSLFLSTGLRAKLLGPISFEGAMNGGYGIVYAGAQPANADMDIGAAVAIGRITRDGEVLGVSNALTFNRFGVHINNGTPWTIKGTAAGIASWVRLYASPSDTGATYSTSFARIDFPVFLTPAAGETIPGSGLALPALTFDTSVLRTVDGFYYTLPPI